MPDITREGAPAVLRALTLAGVHVTGAEAPPRPEVRLIEHLLTPTASQDGRSPGPLPLPDDAAPLERVAREQLAEQVFKPKDLADYDRVVPLPLMDGQLPTPARLAVSSRSVRGGEDAHFVRVDAQLSHLGEVSIRMSSGQGGPLAITLVANPKAGAALADELPALVDDLRKLGIEAAVRVATDAAHA